MKRVGRVALEIVHVSGKDVDDQCYSLKQTSTENRLWSDLLVLKSESSSGEKQIIVQYGHPNPVYALCLSAFKIVHRSVRGHFKAPWNNWMLIRSRIPSNLIYFNLRSSNRRLCFQKFTKNTKNQAKIFFFVPKDAEFFTLFVYTEWFTIKSSQRTLPYTSKFSTSKFVEICNASGGDSASV